MSNDAIVLDKIETIIAKDEWSGGDDIWPLAKLLAISELLDSRQRTVIVSVVDQEMNTTIFGPFDTYEVADRWVYAMQKEWGNKVNFIIDVLHPPVETKEQIAAQCHAIIGELKA